MDKELGDVLARNNATRLRFSMFHLTESVLQLFNIITRVSHGLF